MPQRQLPLRQLKQQKRCIQARAQRQDHRLQTGRLLQARPPPPLHLQLCLVHKLSSVSRNTLGMDRTTSRRRRSTKNPMSCQGGTMGHLNSNSESIILQIMPMYPRDTPALLLCSRTDPFLSSKHLQRRPQYNSRQLLIKALPRRHTRLNPQKVYSRYNWLLVQCQRGSLYHCTQMLEQASVLDLIISIFLLCWVRVTLVRLCWLRRSGLGDCMPLRC